MMKRHTPLLLLCASLCACGCISPMPEPKFIRRPGCVIGAQVIGPHGEPDTCWELNPRWTPARKNTGG